MKKLLTSVAILFMAVAAVQAQDGQMHKGQRGHRGEMMQKLNFSEEQKQKMKLYNEDFKKQMVELKKNDNISVKEYRSRMEALKKDHQTKVKSLLTNDQRDQIEKAKLERKAKHESFSKDRMEKMKTELGLNNDQGKRLSELNKNTAEKFKSIRENEALSQEQKKEQMQALKQKQNEGLKSILTEEQLQKMKEMRKEHPGKRAHDKRV
ncbi:MAG: hypothetical protein M3O67_08980 [Bacteroidota bacterium]|nr:hypothetical protein [Bacteroidota bacterium]